MSTTELITSLAVDWQAVTTHETKRGRCKAIVTGLPGPAFWQDWKRSRIPRDAFAAAGCTLRKIGKAWEVVVWLRPQNLRTAQDVIGAKLGVDLYAFVASSVSTAPQPF